MDILIKPIVTEKLTSLGEKLHRYGFVVDKRANKLQIKKAVESLYNVKVSSVNTLRYGGKVKSRYTKSGILVGSTLATKRAIVTMAKGETIDFYSNI